MAFWSLLMGSTALAQNVVPPGSPISRLPQATLPLVGTEPVPLVQGGVTKQAPVSALINSSNAATQNGNNNFTGTNAASGPWTFNGPLFLPSISSNSVIVGTGSGQIQDAATVTPTQLGGGLVTYRFAGVTVQDGFAGGSNGTSVFAVVDNINTTATGTHVAIYGQVLLNVQPATPSFYTAGYFYSFCNASQGGTSGSPAGACVGTNPQVRLTQSAPNYLGEEGEEIDVEADTGAAPRAKVGLNVTTIGTDAVQGLVVDAAIIVGATPGSPGWKSGLNFSNFNNGTTPISTAGALIIASTPLTVAYGDDYRLLTCTADCFASPGFGVDGSGNLSAASLNVTTTDTVANGINLITSNVLGFTANSLPIGYWNSVGFIVNYSFNGQQQVQVYNGSAGASANSSFVLNNGTVNSLIALTGTGFTGTPSEFFMEHNGHIFLTADTSGNIYTPNVTTGTPVASACYGANKELIEKTTSGSCI